METLVKIGGVCLSKVESMCMQGGGGLLEQNVHVTKNFQFVDCSIRVYLFTYSYECSISKMNVLLECI